MKIHITPNKQILGKNAATLAAKTLREALSQHDEIFIIVATGASQFEMLEALIQTHGIDWSRVTAFHLDEYIGLPKTHPASFRKYLEERFVARLPVPLKAFVPVQGDAPDLAFEIKQLSEKIAACQVTLCLAGIGENGHLAFNDPPADFAIQTPYLVVSLDEACRAQQMGEGWFASREDVPKQAISMSIQEILRAKKIILSVPDARKAQAVAASLEGEISPFCPASILQTHADCEVFLDERSASCLKKKEAL